MFPENIALNINSGLYCNKDDWKGILELLSTIPKSFPPQ